MPRMVLCLEHRVKVQLRRMRNATADKGLFMRCQIVLATARGRMRKEVVDYIRRRNKAAREQQKRAAA
jgi:hypothetical protein